MLKVAVVAASVCLVAGCAHDANRTSSKGDIAKVVEVKSSFGPDFTVADITERAIDPKFFASRKLPDGLTFDPPNCAKSAAAPDMPPDLKGNMAAVSAEGNGLRYVVIAVETSQEVPMTDPPKECNKVSFAGQQVRGGLEMVEAPQIDGTHTSGEHRVLQAVVGGAAKTGELFDYTAQFGDYQVIVIANPLVVPGQPMVPVDTQRARDLLVKAVASVRS